MGRDMLRLILLVASLQGALWVNSQEAEQSVGSCQGECGWNTMCENATCFCLPGYTYHVNGRDCKNASCSAKDCLECSSPDSCYRCVKFILANDQSCVDQCNGVADVVMDGSLQGNICRESDKSNIIIGVVAGVGSALVLCAVLILVVCIYLRKTRKNVSLQTHNYRSPHMEMGSVKQLPSYVNHGFVGENTRELKMGVIDPAIYAMQLEQLRPHTDTLMQLLSQIRPKLRAMDACDPRIPTYKGVIHQLCRVLVLLHRKDNGTRIPSDALGLIEWAQQMLEDHRQQQEEPVGPDVLGDLGQGRISYIDVDMGTDIPHSPVVYAQPLGLSNELQQSDSIVTPYSTVPVPMFQDLGLSKLQKTYATIHRSPSVPSPVNNGKGIYAHPAIPKGNEAAKAKNRTMGYFANGRYYDPNPAPQPEIYAPASSYSDRSTALLTTFVPDRPRSRSLSTSEPSSEGEPVDGEGSEEDCDMFPFDPKEATEPVEV